MKFLSLLIPLNIALIIYLIYPIIELDIRKTSVLHSIVKISGERSSGTGGVILYKGKRYILSNSHVCDKERYKYITYKGAHIGQFEVVRDDAERDLCLIAFGSKVTSGHSFRSILLAEKSYLGERVISAGYPQSQGPVVVVGVLLYEDDGPVFTSWEPCAPGTRPYEDTPWACYRDMHLILSTLFVAPGQSGSPVINIRGELVGVIVATQGGMGVVIPLDTIRAFLAENKE